MTTTQIENKPAADPLKAIARPCLSDDAILNEWLRSDPAPGTYSEYRKLRIDARQTQA